MEETLNIKNIEAEVAIKRILETDNGASTLLREILKSIEDKEASITRRAQNLMLILRNIKPEHLEEVRKVVTPEIFDTLGLKSNG